MLVPEKHYDLISRTSFANLYRLLYHFQFFDWWCSVFLLIFLFRGTSGQAHGAVFFLCSDEFPDRYVPLFWIVSKWCNVCLLMFLFGGISGQVHGALKTRTMGVGWLIMGTASDNASLRPAHQSSCMLKTQQTCVGGWTWERCSWDCALSACYARGHVKMKLGFQI